MAPITTHQPTGALALSAPTTGAGESITCKVTVNGTELVSGPEAVLTTDGAESEAFAVAAKDAHAFVAGDTIGVSYTSTAITNTPTLSFSSWSISSPNRPSSPKR